MHELSIALSLVDLAQEEGERLGARVAAVHLRLGVLAGVAREALIFSYQVACADTPLEGSRLVIEDVPAAVYCAHCRVHRTLENLRRVQCPDCESTGVEIRHGTEMEVFALEIAE